MELIYFGITYMSLKSNEVAQFASDKILNVQHLDRVAAWAKGENVAPITLELDMTDRCNHFCPGCAGGRLGEIDQVNPDSVVEQAAKMGVKSIIFTGGGEPLVNKDTPRMIGKVKDLGMDVALITNGSVFTPEIGEAILKNCTWVRISLDASTPEEYEATHGLPAGGFNKVVGNMRKFAELRDQLGSECTVGAGYLTNAKLVGGMLHATEMCRDAGLDYIQFRPFHYDMTDIYPYLGACQELATDRFQVLYSKHKYDAIAKGDTSRGYDKCLGQQFAAVVQSNGEMAVCCHFRGNRRLAIGNLNNQSMQEVWDSERRQKIVDSIDVHKCLPLCRDNTFNEILWQIKSPRKHVNFL